jgi:hypothetical protein
MNNLEALQAAMQTLNGSGLKLWLYLDKNQDGYRFELSRVDCAKWGIKKDSYYSAVDELINKGFLVQDHYGSNMYWFYEKAVSDKPKSFSEIPIGAFENQKDESENPYRNNTNNTEIIKNTTLTDDNADGVIVDCGLAAIPREESYSEMLTKWFGTFKNEKVCEDPNAIFNKHGL